MPASLDGLRVQLTLGGLALTPAGAKALAPGTAIITVVLGGACVALIAAVNGINVIFAPLFVFLYQHFGPAPFAKLFQACGQDRQDRLALHGRDLQLPSARGMSHRAIKRRFEGRIGDHLVSGHGVVEEHAAVW